MKSSTRGKDVSSLEVTHISKHGLWLQTRDEEIFVPCNEFPRFQNASVSQIMNVEWLNPDYLYWPELHVNLALQSIRRFPLVSQKSRPAKRSGRQAKTKPITRSKSDLRPAPIRTSSRDQRTSFPRTPHFPNASGHVKSDEKGTAQSTD